MVRFLEIFGRIGQVVPQVQKPKKKPRLSEKLLWTGIALVIYLVMGYVELYNIPSGTGDPLRALRVIVGGARGSLAELGIGPIVTGGLILQLLAGAGLMSYDQSDTGDRELFASANKLFSLLFTVVIAALTAFGGSYGALSLSTKVIILTQLIVAGFILILLDEMMQKGWGIGSGISLFILAGTAREIYLMTLSPLGPMGDGYSEGSVIALFQSALAGKFNATSLVIRQEETTLPTIFQLVVTFALLAVVVYLENVSIQVPISSSRARGFSGNYPIKLLFVSTLPIMLAIAIFANVGLVSSVIQNNSNLSSITLFNMSLVDIVGRTDSQGVPQSGLLLYITAPRSVEVSAKNPTRALVYAIILIVLSMFFSVIWMEVSGMDAKSMASQLVEAGIALPGFRTSTKPLESLISDYLDAVTIVGGALIGLLAAVGDIVGVYGSGMGLLLSVGIVYSLYESILREQAEEIFPQLRRLLPI